MKNCGIADFEVVSLLLLLLVLVVVVVMSRSPWHSTEEARLRLETGETPSSISRRLNVNKRTIERWRVNFALYGTAYPPNFGNQGRPRALTTEQAGFLLAYVEERPTAELEEIAGAVFERFGVWISAATVSRYVKDAGGRRVVARDGGGDGSRA